MSDETREALEMLAITRDSISNKPVKRGGRLSAVVVDITPDSLEFVIDSAIRAIKEGCKA